MLASSTELIEQAWRYKQMMGESLRPAGIVAGCLWALDHHVDRLADDHANARILAKGLAGRTGTTGTVGRELGEIAWRLA